MHSLHAAETMDRGYCPFAMLTQRLAAVRNELYPTAYVCYYDRDMNGWL